MTDASTDVGPTPEGVVDALGVVPLLEVYFRRAQAEMPQALREIFAAQQLTARHGGIVVQLSTGRSLSVTELSRRLGVSLSTASELAGDLDRAGLIERRPDPANRRRTLVALTARHRGAVEEFVALRAAPLVRALERLEPRDRQGFLRGLAAWAGEIRDW